MAQESPRKATRLKGKGVAEIQLGWNRTPSSASQKGLKSAALPATPPMCSIEVRKKLGAGRTGRLGFHTVSSSFPPLPAHSPLCIAADHTSPTERYCKTMQNAQLEKNEDDEELVTLDFDASLSSYDSNESESLVSKLKRCGNPKDSTPLPWPQLIVVLLVSLSEGITGGILLPFVAFMVTDLFGYSFSQVGYYGGWLTSAYFGSQVISSVVLGQLSDIKGRRPIMLVGVATNIITTITFGLSRKFWLALLSRFVCGMLNGNIGVVKSYIREITDETNQARCYTLRSSGYSIGAIIGPILGGALARPAIQYPSLFSPTGVWAYFPFLLPCVASAAISAISLVLGYLYLKETVTIVPYEEHEEDYSVEMTNTKQDDARTLPVSVSDSLGLKEDTSTNETSSNDDKQNIPLDNTNPDPSNEGETSDSFSNSPSSNPDSMVPLDPETPRAARTNGVIRYRQNSRLDELRLFWRQLRSRLFLFRQALGEWDVIVSIILYAAISFIILGFDEIIAFWAIRDASEGGINFSSLQVGAAHSIAGIGAILMQIVGYVPLDKALGTQNTLTTATALFGPAAAALPFAHSMVGNRSLLWTFISIIMCWKAATITTSFAAVNLLVSNASRPESTGAVNGLSASTAALARVLAPVVVGSIYAATSNSKIGFPIDYHFAFFLLAFIAVLISVGSQWGLPKSINKRKT